MSNVLAIAAATRTLRNLLMTQMPQIDSDLSDLEVTMQPLDVARKGISKAQLNLYLYQVVFNAAWRNLDMPGRTLPGESAQPALALNLHYLITAWGRGESDTDAVNHRVLAAAMSTLHDRPVLDGNDIRNALPDNDLANQIERIRCAPLPQSIDEISKLWTAFQTNYRVSSAYEATVVLIDSQAPSRARLPVLKRGAQDQGVFSAVSAAPALVALALPHRQTAIRLGDDIVLRGNRLTATDTLLRFSSLRLDGPVDLPPVPGAAPGTLGVHLDDASQDADAPSRWAPGIYTVALLLRTPGLPAVMSNELPLALAPSISVDPLTASTGTVTLTIGCMPRVRDGQRVFLLFGDQLVSPSGMTNPADLHQPTSITFSVANVVEGTYTLRLRVDGADSIPVDFSGSVPVFDSQQQVVVS
jgi:hypothetical protein